MLRRGQKYLLLMGERLAAKQELFQEEFRGFFSDKRAHQPRTWKSVYSMYVTSLKKKKKETHTLEKNKNRINICVKVLLANH